jgi:murein DD-endopeptidase MepM/ murein hydrolase activator NlpD
VAAFFAGMITGMLILAGLNGTNPTVGGDGVARLGPPDELVRAPRQTRRVPPLMEAPSPLEISPVPPADPDIKEEALAELRDRELLVPVKGVTRAELRDSFSEMRERTRQHEALDILAPRGTPVVAVEDGTIAKLFTSVRGGLTIYQFDPSRTYAYYYAHLDRYGPGLEEGDRIDRGQTIGFVGTTGNAPQQTPHLHFSIFLLTDKKQWWQGTPINAYEVWAPPARG